MTACTGTPTGRRGPSGRVGGAFAKGGAMVGCASIDGTAGRGFLGRAERTAGLFLTVDFPAGLPSFDGFLGALAASPEPAETLLGWANEERRGVLGSENLRGTAERFLGFEPEGLELGGISILGYFLAVWNFNQVSRIQYTGTTQNNHKPKAPLTQSLPTRGAGKSIAGQSHQQ